MKSVVSMCLGKDLDLAKWRHLEASLKHINVYLIKVIYGNLSCHFVLRAL